MGAWREHPTATSALGAAPCEMLAIPPLRSGAEGTWLTQVSAPCLDLLRGMLVPEPTQRLSLAAVMRHPWFLEQLPPGYSALNHMLLVRSYMCFCRFRVRKPSVDRKKCVV